MSSGNRSEGTPPQKDAPRHPVVRLLDRLDYGVLVPAAVLLGLAPFVPEPHLVEKVRMLLSGTLTRPLDIFDLCMHGLPVLLLLGKLGVRGLAPPGPSS